MFTAAMPLLQGEKVAPLPESTGSLHKTPIPASGSVQHFEELPKKKNNFVSILMAK